MKKNIIFAAVVIALSVFAAGCTEHVGPAAITDLDNWGSGDGTAAGSGKIKSTSMTAVYSSMTVTTDSVYSYDDTGKITEEIVSAYGYTQNTYGYTYTAAGKLEKRENETGTEVTAYTYDASDGLITRTSNDGTDENVKAFTLGTDNLISRIDESENGISRSTRIINRDANGYITSEDVYQPGGGTWVAEITYVRDDAAKTINVSFGPSSWNPIMTFLYEYDSSGFLQKQTITQYLSGTPQSEITLINTLQSGPFDAGGMNGYYYMDKDLFGVLWMDVVAY
ncbi:MAG: hypothetical protein ACLFP1_01465 [Candidatus Goldiibacteriota bacterium]